MMHICDFTEVPNEFGLEGSGVKRSKTFSENLRRTGRDYYFYHFLLK